MKVHIVVTDGDGKVFEGDTALVLIARVGSSRERRDAHVARGPLSTLDFTLPPRAFIKRNARDLSGPQKFTMLLARLAGGKAGVAISRGSIEKTWNRMTELMGGRFNPAYTTRAKDNGWVDTPKPGSYALLPGWADARRKK